MTIVGVHITKLNAERNMKSVSQKVGINNNITIKEVAEHDFMLGSSKQQGLRFSFVFNCNYTPDIGSIDVEGDVLVLEDEEETKKVLHEWKTNKRVHGDYAENILNSALMRSNIQAIKISQDLNLPSPVPLPRIEKKDAATAKAQPKATAK